MNDHSSYLHFLPTLIEGPWWYASLVKITILLAIAWCVHFTIAKLNSRWRVMLWRSAVIGLVAMLIFDVSRVVSLPMQVDSSVALAVRGGVPKPTLEQSGRFAPDASSVPISSRPVAMNQFAPKFDEVASAPLVFVPEITAPPKEPAASLFNLPLIFGLIWLTGILLLLLLEVAGRRRLRGIVNASDPASDALAEHADRLASGMQIKPCAVRISGEVPSPLVCRSKFGRTLLVPELIVASSSEEELTAILTHELSHVASRDLEWNSLIKIVAALLWPHPLLWRVRAVHVTSCEYVADSDSARLLNDPSLYAQTLAKVALSASESDRHPSPSLPGLAMARKNNLRQRLERVMESYRQLPLSRRRVTAIFTGAILCCVGLGSFHFVYADPVVKPVASADEKTIEVRIVDEDDNPIMDHQLKATIYGEGFDREKKLKPKLIKGNVYQFSIPASAQSLQLFATSAGHVRMMATWRPQDFKEGLPEKFALKLPAGTKVSGRIVDEQQNPVGSAKVHLLVPTNQNDRSYRYYYDYFVTTDKEGRWSSDLMPARLDEVWIKLEHPDFISDNTYGETVGNASIDSLRDGTFVATMKQGNTVKGVVTDASGRPIQDALVCQGSDRFGSDYPKTKTDMAGQFQFENCKAAQMVLTVIAKGFAPDLKMVNVNAEVEAIKFELSKGKPLRIRVVDSNDNPLKNVMVVADSWRGHRSLVDLHERLIRTDANGDWVWEDAPNDPVAYDILGAGLMSVRNNELAPKDEVQIVKLYPTLAMTGIVTDAETGKPIKDFRVVSGIYMEGDEGISWELEAARVGANGKYRYEFDYPHDAHVLKFEALGYKPVVTRKFKSNEGAVVVDVALTPSDSISGTVLTPDGKPATGADVAVALGNQFNQVQNGRSIDGDCRKANADNEGRFAMAAEGEEFKLLFLHESGVAILDGNDFVPGQTIILSKWAKITGTIKAKGKLAKQAEMALGYDREMDRAKPRFIFENGTHSDNEGNFEFNRVLPNTSVYVARKIRSYLGANYYGSETTTTGVNVKTLSGETQRVAVGEGGGFVVGHIDVPLDKSKYAFSSCWVVPVNPPLKRPDDIESWTNEKQMQWYKELSESEAGIRYEKRSRRRDEFFVYADGTFEIDDLPFDEYEINFLIASVPKDHTRTTRHNLGKLTKRFTLAKPTDPNKPASRDLGKLSIELRNVLAEGSLVPELKFTSLDGEAMSLKDFRGKTVLIDFWATWNGPCMQRMPRLNALLEKYKDNEDFVVLGVSVDEKAETVQQPLEKNPHPSVQVQLSKEQARSAVQKFGLQNFQAVYVIGPDGTVAGNELNERDIEVVVKELLEK